MLMLLSVGGAFGLGWWSEHQRRIAVELELRDIQARFATSESNVHVCQLQDQLLSLLDLVDAKNYGAAQSASTAFFDRVRAETVGAADRPEFDKILAQRDAVTAALTRSDPLIADTLRAMRAPLMKMQTQMLAEPGQAKQ